jgi:predicted metal-dependent hydrolase
MYQDRRKGALINPVYRLPIELGKFEISLGSQKVPYTLKRSFKARLIWLNIKRQTGLTVTIPHNYSVSHLTEYLESKSGWILRNLHRYCGEIPAPPVISLSPAKTISYLGKNLVLPGSNLPAADLRLWLKTQATALINNKVRQFARQIGVIYNRVVIRDQKSRWGSCSRLKNLNFNWRLIMVPEAVLDYVIIHELCHLREMSHSKIFWNLVSHHCPKWHEYRLWLNDHSLELHAQLQF